MKKYSELNQATREILFRCDFKITHNWIQVDKVTFPDGDIKFHLEVSLPTPDNDYHRGINTVKPLIIYHYMRCMTEIKKYRGFDISIITTDILDMGRFIKQINQTVKKV